MQRFIIIIGVDKCLLIACVSCNMAINIWSNKQEHKTGDDSTIDDLYLCFKWIRVKNFQFNKELYDYFYDLIQWFIVQIIN